MTAPSSEQLKKRFESAPCFLCGYNGSNYYQPAVHSCADFYHGYRPWPSAHNQQDNLSVSRIPPHPCGVIKSGPFHTMQDVPPAPAFPREQPAVKQGGEVRLHPAVENLRNYQRQLDMDGCEVGVSRQAVDETLAELDRLQLALTAAQQSAGMWEREYRIEHGRVEQLTDKLLTAQQELAAANARIAELEQRADRMRAKLLELAGDCECGGSGLVTIRGMCGGVEMDCDDQPCPECEDIREAAQ